MQLNRFCDITEVISTSSVHIETVCALSKLDVYRKSHPRDAEVFYRKYAVLTGIIFEKCDKQLPVEKVLAK